MKLADLKPAAEISRAQVWQWIRNSHGVLSDGRKVTKELFRNVLDEELAKVKLPANNRFDKAREDGAVAYLRGDDFIYGK